jgi:hypothetical protein
MLGAERRPDACIARSAHRAGRLRGLSPELGQMVHSPGHHHIDADAGPKALRVAEAAVFDAAPALEGAVVDLDALARGVPVKPPPGLFEVLDLHRGHQQPFHRLGVGRWMAFKCMRRPKGIRCAAVGFSCLDLDVGMANLKSCDACLASPFAEDVQRKTSGERLSGHPLPQGLLFHHVALASAIGTDQQIGALAVWLANSL